MHAEQDTLAPGLLAAWATSVAVAILIGCVYAMTGNRQYSPELFIVFAIALNFGFVAAVFGLFATIAFGLPIFTFCIRRGHTTTTAFVGAGAAVSILLAALMYAGHLFGGFLMEKDFNFGLLAIVVAGPLAGFSFWLVHRRRQSSAS
jgi:hypothetical protein